MPRDQVFISYSHEDTKWREDLEKHLKPYLRAGSIKGWSDKQIIPGSEWFGAIKSALVHAHPDRFFVRFDFERAPGTISAACAYERDLRDSEP